MNDILFPSSSFTVSVCIIDTTAWAYKIPRANLFAPKFHGLETFDICSYAFLITHGPARKRRRVLFDLVIRKDWQNLVPSMVSKLGEWGAKIEVQKEVVNILSDGGVDPGSVEAIIWSPSTFPPSTKVIVGPEISEKFIPGWPAIPNAEFKQADLEGREVICLEHDDFSSLTFGGFKALDYFGDGSFYILDAPGHSLGHLNALARTSSQPDTFISLAADSVHLGGEIRPSQLVPLPEQADVPGICPRPCPVEKLLVMHPRRSCTLPFLGLNPCFPEDLKAAGKTIEMIQRFDADDRVLVVFSHDASIYDILEFFPETAMTGGQKDGRRREVGTSSRNLRKHMRAVGDNFSFRDLEDER